MMEILVAKLEGVEPNQRLNPNAKLGFVLNDKLTQKIKRLHDLLLAENLVTKNETGKIFKLNATAKECINFINELGEK